MLLSILKFSVVSYLVYNALAQDMKNVVRSGLIGVEAGVYVLWDMCIRLIVQVAAFLFAVGVLDRFWQQAQWQLGYLYHAFRWRNRPATHLAFGP